MCSVIQGSLKRRPGTWSWTGSSQAMTPLATRCATAVPLIGVDIDASENTVSGVIGSVLSTSRTP